MAATLGHVDEAILEIDAMRMTSGDQTQICVFQNFSINGLRSLDPFHGTEMGLRVVLQRFG